MIAKSRVVLSTLAAFGLATLAAMPAQAGIITLLDKVTANADGTYTYTYGATLSRGSELQGTDTMFGGSGDRPVSQFFTVYDFGPVIGPITFNADNSSLALQFSVSVENVSTPQSFNTLVSDDASLSNIRFTYSAPTTLTYNGNDDPNGLAGTTTVRAVVGAFNLGTFNVVSAFAPGEANNLSYDSNTYNSDNLTRQGENGLVDGPSVINSVPEPASLAVLGMGLVGLGLARRRKMI